MFRCIVLAAAVASLAGCTSTSMSRVSSYPLPVHHVKSGNDTYRVYDHKTDKSLLVAPNMGRILAMGAAQGATLGVADAAPPEQKLETAANQYLADTGRASCKVTKGYLLQKPLYEFWYECTSGQTDQAAIAVPKM